MYHMRGAWDLLQVHHRINVLRQCTRGPKDIRIMMVSLEGTEYTADKEAFDEPNPILKPTVPNADATSKSVGKGDWTHGFVYSISKIKNQQKERPETTLMSSSLVYCSVVFSFSVRVARIATAFGLELITKMTMSSTK